jgi:succinate-semialdehyde dehydrogenase/glutarate-semialdehyde dehydrogenase
MIDPRTVAASVIGAEPYRMLIGGEWHNPDSAFAVTNPATGDVLVSVPEATAHSVGAAINAADSALPSWAATPAPARAQLLRRVAALMIERQERLATIMTLEQGKPLSEARGEIAYAASFLSWFAGEAERVYGRIVPASVENKRLLVLQQPVGVCALITPWNFPAAMLTRKIGPALAAGCTIVCKPAEQTPLTALELGRLFQAAGLPAGVVNIVTTSNPIPFADAVFKDDRVRKVSFTGSTAVGKELIRRSADGVKRLSLELGGNAPFIVFDDADLEAAATGALLSKFRNSGQTCVCTNRVLVQRAVSERFTELFTANVQQLKLGNGLEPGVAIGPLIDSHATAKVAQLIEDAVTHGAEVLLGGAAPDDADCAKGSFWLPTVLVDVQPSMLVAQEETFGPVAPLIVFDDEAEALHLANDTPFGLAAYFFTRDVSRVLRVAEALEYGIVGANDSLPSVAQAPFGGYKQSGLGREGGTEGIGEFLETKYVSLGL